LLQFVELQAIRTIFQLHSIGWWPALEPAP
jgi:hypothetical protein